MAVVSDAVRERRLHEERVLVGRLGEGDTRAFEQLYASYEGRLYGFCHRITGNPHDAADLVQETFVRAIGRFGELDISTLNVGAYLFATARNLAYKTFERQQRVELDGDLEERLGASSDAETQPEASLLIGEQRNEVHEASLRLAPRQRTALALRDLEGCSYGEIATVLAINENAVAQLISRARIRLREELRMTQVDERSLPPACRERLPALSAFVDGHLREAPRLELEHHLGECAHCRAALAAFEETSTRYRAILPALPLAGLAARTRGAVSQHAPRTLNLSPPPSGLSALKGVLVAAAVKQPIAALVVASTMLAGGIGAATLILHHASAAAATAPATGPSSSAPVPAADRPSAVPPLVPAPAAPAASPATSASPVSPVAPQTGASVAPPAPAVPDPPSATTATVGTTSVTPAASASTTTTTTTTTPAGSGQIGELRISSIAFPTRSGDPLTVTLASAGGATSASRLEVATSDPDLAPTSRAVPALAAGASVRLTFTCSNYRGTVTATLASGSEATSEARGICL